MPPPAVSGPLPRVAAAARRAAPADPYRLPLGGGDPWRQHTDRLSQRPEQLGPPEISGPLPVPPWPDHLAGSGPMPALSSEPDWFGYPEPDPLDQASQAAEDSDDDLPGWTEGDDGPLLPLEQRATKPGGNGRFRRRVRRRSAPLIALLVIAVFLASGAIVGYHFLRAYVVPPDYSGPGYGTVIVAIKQDETATDVAQTLFKLRVVASARAFVKAAEQSSQQTALEPGSYRLHRHMKAALAFDLLLSPGARIQLRITIPEGLRVDQIVSALSAKSGISAKDYRRVLASPAALGLPSYANNRPEGYLFPATYSVQPKMTAADVLRAMVQQFNTEAARINLTATARRVNLTPVEAVIVASLVQAEGGKVADFPKIARVIYNRLDVSMPLQLDSTVMYALHTYGILATNQQIKTASPYNTYLHKGLPPGPIDSPGLAAINAALHPAHGNWLYFVTVDPKTRRTEFTASSAVFDRLRAELQRNLGNSG